jgi:crossover junction endodeoxyribonuclease RuvC
MIKVVGIDPGLAGTGVGVISGENQAILDYAYGSVTTHSKDPVSRRLDQIYTEILAFLCSQKPDLVVIEDIYSLEKYPGSGIILGKVSGVLLVAACKAGVDAREIPVREVKKIVCGNGGADKQQLERSVRNFLNHAGKIRPFHASDALALALAGFFRYGSPDYDRLS